MRVNIALEQRFLHTPDGATYDDGHATYALWSRYLDVFEEVRVVGRSQPVSEVPPGYVRVDGPGVSVLHVPFYQGPGGLLRRLPGVLRTLARTDGEHEALIVRLSGVLAHLAALRRMARGQPFAAEVVNDPYLGLAGEGMQHPLRQVFRHLLTAATKWQCRAASAAQYVTREALQRRYPPGAQAFGVSDAVLPPESFGQARSYRAPARRAVLVGSVEQPHKAVDVVLRALARLRQGGPGQDAQQGGPGQHRSGPGTPLGLDLHFTLVGDGPLRPGLEALARELGVEDAVTFAGQASTPVAVRAHLDAADLFLMPSRTEGLPRALAEAMARGLPALGSDVGGIPELLDPSCLVRPGDVDSLAAAWAALSQDPERLTRESARNLEVARGYADSALRARRGEFLRAVRAAVLRAGPEAEQRAGQRVPGARR